MTVPLHKVLVALLVLKDCAEAAKSDPLERVVTTLDQVEQDLNTLNVQEVKLRSLVAEDGVLKTVKSRQNESRRVTTLINFTILHVVFQDLDAALPAEHLLILTTVLANV